MARGSRSSRTATRTRSSASTRTSARQSSGSPRPPRVIRARAGRPTAPGWFSSDGPAPAALPRLCSSRATIRGLCGRPTWRPPPASPSGRRRERCEAHGPRPTGTRTFIGLSDNRIVFLSYEDGWPHLYSVSARGGAPMLLTPGGFMVEHVAPVPMARSRRVSQHRTVRRQSQSPARSARPRRSRGTRGADARHGARMGAGRHRQSRTCRFIGATAERPPLPMVVPARGGRPIALASDRVPNDLPASLVVPKPVTYKASDGVVVHAQLFEPPDVGAAPRPAIVYVHGGPPRQMLLGWHYSDYYARAYAANRTWRRVVSACSRSTIASASDTATSSMCRLAAAPRSLGVPRCQGGCGVPANAAAGRPLAHRHLRRFVTAAFDRAGAGAQFRSLPGGRGHSWRARLHRDGLGRRDALQTALSSVERTIATRRSRSPGGRHPFRRSRHGNRRCCSFMPTMTATCDSRRPSTSCSA